MARLWATVEPPDAAADRPAAPAALSTADEQANAQARLDGTVRAVAVGTREG